MALEVKETPTDFDLNNLRKLAENLNITKHFLIGKNNSPKFDQYIWGGSIRLMAIR